MKRIFLFFIILFLVIITTGCGYRGPVMDQPTEDGSYYYQNKDLGFSLKLPSEFEYYQTQRKETESYTDIEIFVPTSDIYYPKEVPGYGKPIIVRVFDGEVWEDMTDNEYKLMYRELVDKGGRVYTIRFWDEVPTDWQDKWNQEMQESITRSFIVK